MISHIDQQENRLVELADRLEVSELVNRYVVLLDTQDENGFDPEWPSLIFTEDVRMELPVGTYEGLDGLAEFHYRAKSEFARTHHVSSDHRIVVNGDFATVRCQMIATHVHRRSERLENGRLPLFRVGGSYEAEAVRTLHGWRFRSWVCRVSWHEGTGPVELC
ncbi:nuclear transport factor 2 family protein [Actinopolyspora mortivallis]|uniref:Nuclear transport factor 2 family protein n=1 Tax=Actinopolyspora mortivallis TaxID=33906 RepID=A0A2T0GYW7_ACTMO|nr:nuclear transport factor 2 family protein [Actinopolyspora mortivallis]PRW64223.1 nuclear transport factor 2 family protein [Actinopolyspora mortivallis]